MFGDNEKRLRVEDLERAVDDLRGRFGHQVVQRGIVLFDRKFSEVNPREEHTIHPVPLQQKLADKASAILASFAGMRYICIMIGICGLWS